MNTFEINTKINKNYKDFLEEMDFEFSNPCDCQKEVLFKLLNDNKDTVIGRLYNFSEIKSIEDFKNSVPINDYDWFDPYIKRMIAGEKNVLTSYNYQHFNLTSGTSGVSKYIPFTDMQQKMCIKYNEVYLNALKSKFFGDRWMKGRSFVPVIVDMENKENDFSVGHSVKPMLEEMSNSKDRVMYDLLYVNPIETITSVKDNDLMYLQSRFFLEDKFLTGVTAPYYFSIIMSLNYIR